MTDEQNKSFIDQMQNFSEFFQELFSGEFDESESVELSEDLQKIKDISEDFLGSEVFQTFSDEEQIEADNIIESLLQIANSHQPNPLMWDEAFMKKVFFDEIPENMIADEVFLKAIGKVIPTFFEFLKFNEVLPQGGELAKWVVEHKSEIVEIGMDDSYWSEMKHVFMDICDEEEFMKDIEHDEDTEELFLEALDEDSEKSK